MLNDIFLSNMALFQPENGLGSLALYAEDIDGYRVALWVLNEKIVDDWQFGQFKLAIDYEFRVT